MHVGLLDVADFWGLVFHRGESCKPFFEDKNSQRIAIGDQDVDP